MFANSRKWDARVADAERVARTPAFRDLRDRIVAFADPQAGHTVVDIGSGTGLLSLAFAERAARVWAVDSSPAMNEYLRTKAASAGLNNVDVVLASATSLPLVDGIADIVVSNYCLHELRHREKGLALAEARRVLKPGGRLMIGDMMFSFNPLAERDRSVVATKLAQLARRGLPGIWRVAKNAGRLAARRWEHPASAAWWSEALVRAGFRGVNIEVLGHEGGIAVAAAPARDAYGSARSAAVPGTVPSAARRERASRSCLR